MRENVIFKGGKGGLELVINEAADFTAILAQLKEKLEAAAYFFTGSTGVKVASGHCSLTNEERSQLIRLLAGYGLALDDQATMFSLPSEQLSGNDAGQDSDIPVVYRQEPEGGQTLIVSRTLRGGQRIVYHGSVVIIGDVNPGAEIIAGGNITVQGACRGLAHAGANGNHQATITADKLVAGQLRIAGIIARAPDSRHEPTYRESARIAGGIVTIEPAAKDRIKRDLASDGV